MADFATLAELQTFLGGSSSPGARGTALLGHASAAIRRFTGQTLDVVTGAQEEFGPTPLETLFLLERPVTAVTSVVENAVTITAYVWTRWGTIRHDPDAAWDLGNTVVTYDHGYATTSAEAAALKSICLEVAARAYTNERPDLENFGTEFAEAVGFSPDLFLSEQEKMMLRDFGAVMVG